MKQKFIPPLPSSVISNRDQIPEITPELQERFNRSPAKKYAEKAIARDNVRKRRIKITWIKNHSIDLLALAISIISLIISILK